MGESGQRPPIREVASNIVTWKDAGWIGGEVRALAATRPDGPPPGRIVLVNIKFEVKVEGCVGRGDEPIMQTVLG